MKKKKILMIGTRGIPAKYGGFETCVEEISIRLRDQFDIIVYSREKAIDAQNKRFNNIKIIYIPSLKLKALETLSHTFICTLHAIFYHRKSLIVAFNVANTLPLIIAKIFGMRIVINTDGLEWKRDKWGAIGRTFFQFSEWLASRMINYIVTDSIGMHDYYKNRWSVSSDVIEYGAYIEDKAIIPSDLKNKYGIKEKNFFLQITRFEPENNPLLTINAFNEFNQKFHNIFKLIIIGDVPYPSEYSKAIWEKKSENVILPGYMYDKNILNVLRTNCLSYIHGNQVGGTNPALLEAMGASSFIICRNVHFNREVLQSGGVYYDCSIESLRKCMEWVVDNKDILTNKVEQSKYRIKEYYNWENISNKYSSLFHKVYTE
jgi:glycosyltransferase involved in cell wall biosynthesis